MIHLCDANVFIAIAVAQHSSHKTAARWFTELHHDDTAAFCRATQNTFLRLLTIKIADNYSPLTNQQAWSVYDQLCRDEAITFLEEPAGLESLWRKFARPKTPSPKLWMDAYLAAFALAGGFRIATFDAAFKSFQPHGLDLLLLTSPV